MSRSPVTAEARLRLAVVLLTVAAVTVAYWVVWFVALGLLLVAGGAGLCLFGMDVLYDAEHRVWAKGAGGAIEAVINAATLVINVGILRWAWRRRAELLEHAPVSVSG